MLPALAAKPAPMAGVVLPALLVNRSVIIPVWTKRPTPITAALVETSAKEENSARLEPVSVLRVRPIAEVSVVT